VPHSIFAVYSLEAIICVVLTQVKEEPERCGVVLFYIVDKLYQPGARFLYTKTKIWRNNLMLNINCNFILETLWVQYCYIWKHYSSKFLFSLFLVTLIIICILNLKTTTSKWFYLNRTFLVYGVAQFLCQLARSLNFIAEVVCVPMPCP